MAVVAGKFQAPEPTEAHIALIVKAKSIGEKVLVLIGQNPASKNHEIDLIPFDVRRDLIANRLFKHYQAYNTLFDTIKIVNDFIFIKNMDVFNIDLWSKNVDSFICLSYLDAYGVTPTNENVVLVGGRDSFLKTYNGMYSELRYVELVCGNEVSGTEARLKCKEHFIADPMFIRGAFHHALNQYPIAFQCVDVLILRSKYSVYSMQKNVVLGRKKNEDKYVFIGGFSEPTSISLEADALKEVSEEANYTGSIKDLSYVSSTLVDDPRYRKSMHKIKTAMFVLDVVDNIAVFTPGDDIVEILEIPVSEFTKEHLMKKHHPLFDIYKAKGVI